MAQATPPLLTGVDPFVAVESKIYTQYQGIRLTIIPAQGSLFEVSAVDGPDDFVHNSTMVLVDTMAFFELTWPYLLVTCTSGSGRAALV